ncbi:hypothetical protein AAFF_G00009780 [Aldrovandia affinis]|uniref:Uncharacterized protein n=1 Tax=Aldrovandia affinis TaxID=143900 RepID=A0AAD7WIC9_9TELE|nr:hypothetical protein AAFF_G00009780 [Aldrovandia affinis]
MEYLGPSSILALASNPAPRWCPWMNTVERLRLNNSCSLTDVPLSSPRKLHAEQTSERRVGRSTKGCIRRLEQERFPEVPTGGSSCRSKEESEIQTAKEQSSTLGRAYSEVGSRSG